MRESSQVVEVAFGVERCLTAGGGTGDGLTVDVIAENEQASVTIGHFELSTQLLRGR
jgi:hypothetical protein